jgi:hypothetical protein
LSASSNQYPDSGELLVAGIEGALKATFEDVLKLLMVGCRLDLVLAAAPFERIYERSEWFHGSDSHLLGLTK